MSKKSASAKTAATTPAADGTPAAPPAFSAKQFHAALPVTGDNEHHEEIEQRLLALEAKVFGS